MTIEKTPNGRFRAHLKSGRVKVASRTFDTRREATAWLKSGRVKVASRTFDTRREANAWLTRERAALAGGVDPRAGKERVRDLLPRWLEIRRTTVAVKTWQADRELLRLVPTSLQALQVSAVSGREVARSFEALLSRGLSHNSVVRYRASLSVFFAWCVREKLIATNPVTAVRVPKSSLPPVELQPFTEDELEAAWLMWRERDPRLADVMLVLGWTGLRWAEARELRVGDFIEIPSPALLVRRSAPEGVGVKATKSGRSRRVPVANRVLPIIKRFTLGKGPDDLLLTTYMGAQLHRNAVVRTLDWKKTGQGRRIHDLRDTAACLWLARGVDPGTVQAWMGHESIATTNRYLHYLGTTADVAGLARLNAALASAGGPREAAK